MTAALVIIAVLLGVGVSALRELDTKANDKNN